MASVATACSISTTSLLPGSSLLRSASQFSGTRTTEPDSATINHECISSRWLITRQLTGRACCYCQSLAKREWWQPPSFSHQLLSHKTLLVPSLSFGAGLCLNTTGGELSLKRVRARDPLSSTSTFSGIQLLLRSCSGSMGVDDNNNACSRSRSEDMNSNVRAQAHQGNSDGGSRGSSGLSSGVGSAMKELPPSPSNQKGEAAAISLKLALIFGLWYFFNVVFNIYNKKVLNVFPFPWLTSTLSLLAGAVFMLGMWSTGAQPVPRLSKEFMMALAPVALFHTIGHVAATVSMSKVAVSFTHIIKSAEPVFSVMISRLFLGEQYLLPVYLSLFPIVLGCCIAAATELTFNAAGFWGAMISNVALVFRNVFSKKGLQKFKEIDGVNLYAMISIVSLLYLTPFTFYMEGAAAWKAGWRTAITRIGPQVGWWLFLQSLFYHLYNQVSYVALNDISPLTFSVGNTMKRVAVIVTSIIAFNTKISPLNAIGSAVAILGTFLYSQVTALPSKKVKKQ